MSRVSSGSFASRLQRCCLLDVAQVQLALHEPVLTIAQGLAEKRKQKGLVSWQNRSFSNQARSDGLQLRHWVKCAKDATGRVREVQEGDYPFAKCNKQVG